MENKLTNEEIAKVFSMYLGSEFLMESEVNSKDPNKCIVKSVDIIIGFVNFGYGNAKHFNECKLLLTNLSDIADEDAINVAKISNSGNGDTPGVKKYVTAWIFRYTERSNINQYLISQGYAVPLFFDPNHWANGKTAIELGIAIDKNK